MRKAFIVIAASALAAGSAVAQEVYIEGEADLYDDPVLEEPAYVDERVIERVEPVEPLDEPRALGPRVYGWEYAEPPTSCGTFKYWNGEYCADARSEPPDAD
ncbi:hypothetical protein [Hyphomicrobium sp.]|uniref:hypothetical protein n=1 Tax=Hyphomicrobium sp. TaxID=82 RepID=UPI002C282984|nr:hypothetical protein [Hyphomicrobium sp.]HRN89234.1 hypothetical protein [Hyphomicrobium sp.]HRQ27676.1 hypothetical protein [Hyphomicrobium sp.]